MVLKNRARGYTQLETANSLGMTRANVSMVESRAKRKIANARTTIKAYESLFSKHSVFVPKGTRLQQVPSLVFSSADSQRVHIKGNLIDIIRMVKAQGLKLTRDGVTIRPIRIEFTENGSISIAK